MIEIKSIVEKLFYNQTGQIIVSVIFGLSLALMFNRVCKDNCLIYYAPHIEDIDNKMFKIEDTCYKYKMKNVKCNDKPIEQYNDNLHPDNKIVEENYFNKLFNK